MDWHEYFLMLAKVVALKSKDPSKQVGAVIVGPDKQIVSTGFNGFPRGVKDGESVKERLTNRELKLRFTAHAEANAVFQAARHGIRTKGCTLYVSSLPPCCDCAQAIIQAGIVELYIDAEALPIPERWKDSIEASMLMFDEAGIPVRYILLSEDVKHKMKVLSDNL